MRSLLYKKLANSVYWLRTFAPYSTSPRAKTFENALDHLLDVQAALELVDGIRPGFIDQLVADAYTDLEAARNPHPEVLALIDRYTTRRPA